jgi:HSP20 family molecular chaperone IbpA
MQTTRSILPKHFTLRSTITPAKRHSLLKPITHRKVSNMSSFFPRYVGYPEQSEYSLTPLFRLLDDFDTYRDTNASSPARQRTGAAITKTFNPKFDVKEVADHYELHGELPGIDQKDVEIEFTDAQTLSVHGRSERSYEAGTPPGKLLGAAPEQGRITEAESHRATVADEEAEKAKEAGLQVGAAAKEGPQEKFWVSERSVGEFARSFHFPTKVDQEAVKASMKNGILSIVVPKAQAKAGTRKIQIS